MNSSNENLKALVPPSGGKRSDSAPSRRIVGGRKAHREPHRVLRPLVPLLVAFIAGIVAGTKVPGYNIGAVVLAAVFTAPIIVGVVKKNGAIVSPPFLFCVLGYLTIQFWAVPPLPSNHISHYTDSRRFLVSGTVSAMPVMRQHRTKFIIKVETLGEKTATHAVTGKIRVTVMGEVSPLAEGDRVRFSARIRSISNFRNPGGFDYRRYMGFRRIHGTSWVSVEKLVVTHTAPKRHFFHGFDDFREQIGRLIQTGAKGESRAVLNALIRGDRGDISPGLREAFNRAGIGHLLAISGLHIGIVASVAFFVFKWILSRFTFFLWHAWTRKGAALLTLVPVLIYGMLSGLSPSTQRAVIMVVVFLMSFVFERESDALNTLALAALLIVLVSPPSVFSISFQLSFTAVLAIVYGLSRIPVPEPANPGFGYRLFKKGVVFFLVSLLAILGTLPPVMAYFNQVSLIGLITNCVFIPLIGFGAVPLGLLAVFVHPLLPGAAMWIIRIDAWMMDHVIGLVYYFSNLSFAAVKTITPNAVEIGCYYALAWAILKYIGDANSKEKPPFGSHTTIRSKASMTVAMVAMAILAADAGYWVYQRYQSSELKVTAIDVGQGTASLVEFPKGKVFLVDGGGFSDNAVFDMGARVIAPFLWRKKIQTVDTVVLSHPNSDHLNGLLYIVTHFNVKNIWTNGEAADTMGYQKFVDIIRKKNIPMPQFQKLNRAHVVDGVVVKILYPPVDTPGRPGAGQRRKGNDNCLVVKIGYGSVSFLLPGDLTAPAEAELVKIAGEELKSTVLMAPHHGSRTSSTQRFLDGVDPDIVAVSAGWKNRYHFPHSEVLGRYRQKGIQVYRTDHHGAVRFATDGKTVVVHTEVTDAHGTVSSR